MVLSFAECGGQLNTPTGVITSPNYPNQYPHRRVCTWDITVPMDRRVTLTFNDFRLDGSGYCWTDFIIVSSFLLNIIYSLFSHSFIYLFICDQHGWSLFVISDIHQNLRSNLCSCPTHSNVAWTHNTYLFLIPLLFARG